MNYKALSKFKVMNVPIVIMILLVIIRWYYGVLLFHTLAELFSVIVGVLMLVIVWNTRQFTNNNFLVYLGIGFFWVAVLDTWHTFTVQGMPFFNITDEEITLHFWIYARLFEAFLILSAPIFLSRKKFNAPLVLIIGGIITLVLVWASIFLKSPKMLTPEGLTILKVAFEGIIISFFSLSIVIYFRLKERLAPNVFFFLIVSICSTILAELTFTLYTDFSGIPFAVGHLFKFLSFWMIYLAIVETTLIKPFNMLAQTSNSYDAIPHPAIVVDKDCIISQVNRAAEIFSGESASYLQHKHIHEYFHQQDITINDCEMCQAIMCGVVLNELTVSFTNKNQCYLTSLAVVNVGDHNAGMVQSFTNISKQVLVEQVLRKSEAHLETLIKTLPDLIWLKDPKGCYISCNSKFESFFGVSKAEIIGKTDYDFVDKELADFFRENDKTAMALNRPSINEETITYADDGHTEVLETIKTPMFELNGELVGILGVGRDITQRKNTEKQLAESEARFRKLFETTDAISVQGYDKDRKVIYWNYASEKLYGYSAEQALGRKIEDLIIPDEMRQQVIDGINSWMQDGAAIPSSELTLQNSGGQTVQVYSNHVMFHNHDNEAEMYCIDINLSEYKAAQNALLESEMMLDAITNQSIEGISVADIEGNYTFVNDAFCKMTGYSEEELLSLSVFDVKAPGYGGSSFDKSKISKEGYSVRALLQRKNKTTFMSEIIGKGIQIGGIPHVLGVVRDISSLMQKEQSIRTLSQAVEQAPVSIIITDIDGKIEYVNHSFELTTGYTFAEVKGENPRILKSGNTPVSVYKDLWHAISSGKAWEGEIQNRKKNGELYWEYGHFAPVIDEYGVIQHYLASKEDITLRKQQQEQISHQAHFDILTDLPNRFLALDRLAQLLREAKRYNEQVAVLFLDLDDFKKINDTLGHATGDKLLIEVARRLLSVIRSEDTVGRLGGDEFLILLGRLKRATEAEQIAEAILKRLTEIFKIEDRELMVSASIGITVSPDDGDNPAELLRDADAAMYNAKALGRNTYSFFTDEMNKHLQRRLAIEEQIYGALTRQEFIVFYQPQINISTGKIMGAEALLRWSNPVLGDVSPNEFIPIAEQTGLIVPIGQFVLTEALNKTALWQKDFDAKFRIAVNLSPAQFRDPKLVKYIEGLLQQSGVSSASLELEITEGVLMNGHSYIDSALSGLNKLGVSIAMDDFGIGYSSLSYLRNYPFDVLKIDRSFINDIAIDPADRKLIIATIAMAHGLNLKVVAEGVETQEQYDDLKALGCDYAQGYLIGAPTSTDDMSQLLMK